MGLQKKGFVVSKSKNVKNYASQNIKAASFKDSKWVLREIEIFEWGKRVVLMKSCSSKEGDKFITDESIV